MYCSVASRIYVKIPFPSCLSNVSANFMDEIVLHKTFMDEIVVLLTKHEHLFLSSVEN